MKALIIALIMVLFHAPVPQDNTYSVWANDSCLHLILSDNGTPDQYDDDWIVDWETNRDYAVNVFDK